MPIATDLLAQALAASAGPPHPPEPPQPPDPPREAILDAALHLAATSGTRNVTMDEVAVRAGVGRMTVYRRFRNRQALLDALSLREARRCLAEIAAAFDPRDPIADRAADVFLTTVRLIREHPLLERLARVEPEALLHELIRDDSAVFALVRAFLVEQIAAAQARDELDPHADPPVLADLVVRLAASFVLIPAPAPLDERAVRATLSALFQLP